MHGEILHFRVSPAEVDFVPVQQRHLDALQYGGDFIGVGDGIKATARIPA